MIITWFEVMQMTADGTFYVVRMDRETLPKATVMSGPHPTEGAAREHANALASSEAA